MADSFKIFCILVDRTTFVLKFAVVGRSWLVRYLVKYLLQYVWLCYKVVCLVTSLFITSMLNIQGS